MNLALLKTIFFGTFAAILLLTNPAKATDFTYSQTLDLSSPNDFTSATSESYVYFFPQLASGFTLAAGDTISGTINFAGTQDITLTDPTNSNPEFTLLGFSSPGSSTTGYTSLTTLLGVTGSLNVSNPKAGGGPGSGTVQADDQGLTSSSVSFTGLSFHINIQSISGDTTYNQPYFQATAGLGDIRVSGTSPEPSTYAMLGIGLAGLAFFARRKLA